MEKKKKTKATKIYDEFTLLKEPKLTISEEQRQGFIDSIGSGVPINTALKANKIGQAKFYFWKNLAEQILEIQTQQELDNTKCYEKENDVVLNTEIVKELSKKNTYAHEIVEFIQQFHKAQSSFVETTLTNLQQATTGEWQKFAWLLERARPADFGKKDPDKQVEEKKVNRIKVEFVDANQDKSRLEAMDKKVQEEVLGKRVDNNG